MMTQTPDIEQMQLEGALADFRHARRQAALYDIWARWQGQSSDLLDYESLEPYLQPESAQKQGLQSIPLDAIVGSVGRPSDFTRDFMPRRASDEERWARVKVAVNHQGGLPPIEVYQTGDVYFVLDGNHRVSIARRNGDSHIDAYVTKIPTTIPLSTEDNIDAIICRAQHQAFMADTDLTNSRPHAHIELTSCGHYRQLRNAIDEHHRHLRQTKPDTTYTQAAADWYDQHYLPVIHTVRQRGILRDFPNRTEADLYVWLLEWGQYLGQQLGWSPPLAEAAPEMAADKKSNRFTKLGRRLLEVVTPQPLAPAPEPGQWRQEKLAARATATPHRHHTLFADTLVFIEDTDPDWWALSQGLTIAQRENGRVHGLYVAPDEQTLNLRQSSLQAAFQERCADQQILGDINFIVGNQREGRMVRARWTDLVIFKLDNPPGTGVSGRWASRVGTFIRQVGRPVLVLPGPNTSLQRPLIAYDGSPKSKEALYVATYMAAEWHSHITIISVTEKDKPDTKKLDKARAYLQKHNVTADFITTQGPIADTILTTATDNDHDLIMMGGYSLSPVWELMLGSTVDHILRQSHLPILICH
ncbi:MAG TPA: universal stress protein [Anaerolineae bacterium]|nr:universal stress protein [Anaerolineae bacterium]